jgi:ABC-type multidrug transport system ATPase subunit
MQANFRKAMSKSAAPCALEIIGLRKRFNRPAVDGLQLRVQAGELYALLGPNGAGKTTALRMVAGLLRSDAGSIGASRNHRQYLNMQKQYLRHRCAVVLTNNGNTGS